MTDKQLINIPFAGFYCSWYDSELDECVRRDAEYHASENEDTDESAYRARLFDATDWQAAHLATARKYVQRFAEHFAGELGDIELSFTFESMTSPREYNFSTDRLFAWVPESTVSAMYAAVDRAVLAEVIAERFTSRSGFISFYSCDPEDWHAKPLNEWDCNETCTLLLATIKQYGHGEWEFDLFARMAEEDIYTAWSDAVNWAAVETCAQAS